MKLLLGVIILHSIEFGKLQKSNPNLPPDCDCKWVKSLEMANCSEVRRIKVPGNCGKHVKRLDLTGVLFDNVENFTGTTFENYSNLQQLDMKRIKIWSYFCPAEDFHYCPVVFREDIFIPLISLEVLDLSQIDMLSMEKSMKWPPKLKVLRLTGSKLAEIPSLAYLEHFTEFNGAKNRFRNLPEFNNIDPVIYHIELNDNPLDDLNVSEIAPFCTLRYLGARPTHDGKFSKPTKYCHCIRLRKWMKEKDINGINYLICNTFSGILNEKTCVGKVDLSFSAELEVYNKCMNSDARTSLWEILLFAICFSVLFPVLYFIFEIYNNYFGDRKEQYFERASKLSRSRRSHHSSLTDHDHDDHDDHDHGYDDDDDDDDYDDFDEHDHHRRQSHVNASASFLPVIVHAEDV